MKKNEWLEIIKNNEIEKSKRVICGYRKVPRRKRVCKSKIYIMSGLVGSGKSTKAKEIRKKLDRPYAINKTIILNKDKLREMVFGSYEFDYNYEGIVTSMERTLLVRAIQDYSNIIIDNTHLTKRKRQALIQRIRKINPDYTIIIVACNETKNNLKNRMTDPRGISEEKWEKVIENMKERFEPANRLEGIKLGVKVQFHKIK